MSVIVEAGEVVVVVGVVSVEAGVSCLLAVADFGFLVCESLVEAVLVLVGAAMDEEIRDGGRRGTVMHRDFMRSRLRRGGMGFGSEI